MVEAQPSSESDSSSDDTLHEPIDLLKMSLNEQVFVKLKHNREL